MDRYSQPMGKEVYPQQEFDRIISRKPFVADKETVIWMVGLSGEERESLYSYLLGHNYCPMLNNFKLPSCIILPIDQFFNDSPQCAHAICLYKTFLELTFLTLNEIYYLSNWEGFDPIDT